MQRIRRDSRPFPQATPAKNNGRNVRRNSRNSQSSGGQSINHDRSREASNGSPNVFDLAGPQMIEEIIQGYDEFRKRVAELEDHTSSMNPKPEIFMVFSGNYSPGPDGKSWCGMCNVVADAIKREILPRFKRKGYLLWVRIGGPQEWMFRRNPFRVDKDLQLNSIPAAISWRNKLKLEGFAMISLVLVAELFRVEIGESNVPPSEAVTE